VTLLTFQNPLTIEACLSSNLSARLQGYDVTIGLHGQAIGGKGLSMTLPVDPPLANSDTIRAPVGFGRTRGQVCNNASQPGVITSDTASASNAILGEALNDAHLVTVSIGSSVPSRVKFDPPYRLGKQSQSPPSHDRTADQQ